MRIDDLQIQGNNVSSNSGVATVTQDTANIAIVSGQAFIAYRSYVRYDTIGTTTNGWGSSRTKNVRFTNVTTKGTDLTATQSATNGDLITVNTTGGYLIEALITMDTTVRGGVVISKNTTDPGTNDVLLTQINGTLVRSVPPAPADTNSNATSLVSRVVDLVANDIIRLHGHGSNQAFNADSYFAITRIY